MSCVKGFAAGSSVGRYSGSADAAIEATATAATNAAAKHAGSNVELQTFATEELLKESWIKKTVRKRIDKERRQFPLWIKVPTTKFLLSLSSRRQFLRRLPPTLAANN
jgi:hypothetical protein